MFEEERLERKESFKKFEQTVLQIISANTKIINDRMDKMMLEIEKTNKRIKEFDEEKEEIKKSLETHQHITDTKLHEVKKHVKMNEESIRDIFNKLRIQEDRSRRNNIRVDGIAENEGETWDDCAVKVKSFLNDKLGFNDVNIERAHRVKSKSRQTGPRTIVAKLLNWKVKNEVINQSNKLKDSGFFINEDFSSETLEIRKNLRREVKELRSKGKYAILKYDSIYSCDFKKRN